MVIIAHASFVPWLLWYCCCATIGSIMTGTRAAPPPKSFSFQVLIPDSLRKTNGYIGRRTAFGIFPDGGSLMRAQLYLANEWNGYTRDRYAIRPESLTPRPGRYVKNSDGAYEYRQADSDNDEEMSTTDQVGGKIQRPSDPFVLMMEISRSKTVVMAKAAQDYGAAALIVVPACFSSSKSKDCDWDDPKLSWDDSWGKQDIIIPTFAVANTEASPILAYVQNKSHYSSSERNFPILIDIDFRPERSESFVVEYACWSTPGNLQSETFFDRFKDMALALGRHAFFTPHFVLLDGFSYGCKDYSTTTINPVVQTRCDSLCTNQGRYCAPNPHEGLYPAISGSDIVAKTLRRVCIWSQHGLLDGIGQKWWTYVQTFAQQCGSDPNLFNSKQCIEKVYETAGIDGNAIDLCIQYSGGLEQDKNNTMLDPEIFAQQKAYITYIPDAFVNRNRIHGDASRPEHVLAAICNEYPSGSEPPICLGGAVNRNEHVPSLVMKDKEVRFLWAWVLLPLVMVGLVWYGKRCGNHATATFTIASSSRQALLPRKLHQVKIS